MLLWNVAKNNSKSLLYKLLSSCANDMHEYRLHKTVNA